MRMEHVGQITDVRGMVCGSCRTDEASVFTEIVDGPPVKLTLDHDPRCAWPLCEACAIDRDLWSEEFYSLGSVHTASLPTPLACQLVWRWGKHERCGRPDVVAIDKLTKNALCRYCATGYARGQLLLLPAATRLKWNRAIDIAALITDYQMPRRLWPGWTARRSAVKCRERRCQSPMFFYIDHLGPWCGGSCSVFTGQKELFMARTWNQEYPWRCWYYYGHADAIGGEPTFRSRRLLRVGDIRRERAFPRSGYCASPARVFLRVIEGTHDRLEPRCVDHMHPDETNKTSTSVRPIPENPVLVQLPGPHPLQNWMPAPLAV